MNNLRRTRGQSSLELLITISFGLVILLPIIILALVQIAASSANLSVSEAQAAATKLAEVAVSVGAQGPPAKQLVLIQVPPSVQSITIGNTINAPGHAITFVINTNAGPSDAIAYTPVNVSAPTGGLPVLQGTYLINVTALSSCQPYNTPCVYMQPS